MMTLYMCTGKGCGMKGFGYASQIVDGYKAMREALDYLVAAYEQDVTAGLPAHLWNPEPQHFQILGVGANGDHPWLREALAEPQIKVAQAVKQLAYIPGQDPKTTLVFPGVVVASAATLRRVQALNVAKQGFKEAVQLAKAANSKIKDDHITDMLTAGCQAAREVFSTGGFGTICLKQAYRPVHAFTATESAVFQFYLKDKTSSQKVTAADEIRNLEKRKFLMGDTERAVVEKKIAAVGDVFTKIGGKSTIVAVNVLLDRTVRSQPAGVLPIFVAVPSSAKLRVDFSSLEKPRDANNRKVQPPRAINPMPFGAIPGFSLHARLR